MNMPGFTAEASLCRANEHYRGIGADPTGTAQVVPQLILAIPRSRCMVAMFDCVIHEDQQACAYWDFCRIAQGWG